MKFIALLVLVFSTTVFAQDLSQFNGIYVIKGWKDCQGRMGDKPGTCVFNPWKNVKLDDLAELQIQIEAKSQKIKLTDSTGMSWELDLSQCQSPLSAARGCKAVVSITKEGQFSFSYNEWFFNQPQVRFSFGLFRDDTLVVTTPEREYGMFNIQKITQ